MPTLHDPAALLKELQESNVFFDELVDMIPAKLYIAGNTGDDKYNPKYYKGQHKESKEARRARNKAAKRAKFDPEQSETTRQAQERLTGATTTAPPPAAGNSRIEALRAKLHARLAEKAASRPSDPSVVSKRAARRAEKLRRKQEAVAKKKNASTNMKATKGTNYTVSSSMSASTPVVQDLQSMDFGKLAGLNPTPKHYQDNKALANLNKSRNLEKLLADAQKRKERLEELKRSNDEQDKEKAQSILWGDALKEASGDRVKDNPSKLKEKLKRKAAKKQKSKKAWKSRMEQTKEKMEDRAKIRKNNLEKRKLGGSVGANLSKKRIVTNDDEGEPLSRRQSRAGFEGKKQEFINKKGKKKNQ